MSFSQELERIQEIAKTTGRIANQKGGYIEYIEQAAKAEKEKIASIVSETNKAMRQVEAKKRAVAVQTERRRLQKEATPEMHTEGGIPRMTRDDVPSEITEEQMADVISQAIKKLRSKIDISKSDFTFLLNVMSVNEVNAMDVTVWERVLDWAIKRLELIEQGGPIPEKVVPPQVKPEDVNPYRYDDSPRSAYAQFERAKANKALWTEQATPVREWLTEIVSFDDKDLSAENIEALMKVMRAKNIPFTRETVRREFLTLWGTEMHETSRREAFTPDELTAWETDRIDSRLSSQELKAKYRNKVGF